MILHLETVCASESIQGLALKHRDRTRVRGGHTNVQCICTTYVLLHPLASSDFMCIYIYTSYYNVMLSTITIIRHVCITYTLYCHHYIYASTYLIM
ncbi:hypothetical protein BRADI_4g19863v3 [Brachypodium distachyon]|uniref:Uncharacterized protein n=1 Tax=Brachypodium distachyon TaxID=15368 RepID=A0A2K2CNQ3_BRADI|nr:hypothetical protein BRADI_4g19863v3 [Brachypodium distachyon]PNT63677.1 hypothetical protein BRADI_4g19863v3 [Brachypodium distachyon]PNT63678.1 hypothetical protein BRADI_4g19863v3 [Brachypodium distachyon]